jgi:diguanylate cyclase (GGDEF)-like protein
VTFFHHVRASHCAQKHFRHGRYVYNEGMRVTLLSIARAVRHGAGPAIIVIAGIVTLLYSPRISAPREPLGLAFLLLLALAARLCPLILDADAHDPPLVSSTALLAIIALDGLYWATIAAALTIALGEALASARRDERPTVLSSGRCVAVGALATILGGTLYHAFVPSGAVAPLVHALPALFVAEGTLVCGGWALYAVHNVAGQDTIGAALWHGLFEALPALACEPVLALVLVNAIVSEKPIAVLVATLPLVALIMGLRWHSATRRRLEQAHTALRQAHALLRVQVTTDPLTGLTNRGGFEQALDARLREAHRYERPLAVLLIDLDAFKSINDTYGHACGDMVLVAVAGALRRGLRSSDLPARLGGDEFVALLPETDTARALTLAERVCAEIAALTVAFGPMVAHLTASVGAASTSDDAHADAARLLAAADDAAYAAKRAGKNRARPAPSAISQQLSAVS